MLLFIIYDINDWNPTTMRSFTGNFRIVFGVHGTTHLSIQNYLHSKLQRKPRQLGQYNAQAMDRVTADSGFDSQHRQAFISFPECADRLWGPTSLVTSYLAAKRQNCEVNNGKNSNSQLTVMALFAHQILYEVRCRLDSPSPQCSSFRFVHPRSCR